MNISVFCFLVFIFSGLVSIIGGISLTSWNSWYFSAVWFCYWSLVNRGQTLLEQEWIPLFAYEWVFVWALILSIYANANSYIWRGVEEGTKNQNQNERLDSWKCLFSIICPVPFIFSIAWGFKNGPHHVQECFWYKAFWFNQIAEGKNSSSEWTKCQAIVSSQYS